LAFFFNNPASGHGAGSVEAGTEKKGRSSCLKAEFIFDSAGKNPMLQMTAWKCDSLFSEVGTCLSDYS
jgi:hypothetical protein